MARGSGMEIVITSPPRGVYDEGYLTTGQTLQSGTIVQEDATIAQQTGRSTFKKYDRAADGDRPLGALWVVLSEDLLGKGPDHVFQAGDRIKVYCLVPGEEYNLRVKDLPGTADDHAAGEQMMVDDTTGLLIAVTGSPQSAPFLLKEALVDVAEDTLAWVRYGGF